MLEVQISVPRGQRGRASSVRIIPAGFYWARTETAEPGGSCHVVICIGCRACCGAEEAGRRADTPLLTCPRRATAALCWAPGSSRWSTRAWTAEGSGPPAGGIPLTRTSARSAAASGRRPSAPTWAARRAWSAAAPPGEPRCRT